MGTSLSSVLRMLMLRLSSAGPAKPVDFSTPLKYRIYVMTQAEPNVHPDVITNTFLVIILLLMFYSILVLRYHLLLVTSSERLISPPDPLLRL